MSSEEKHLRQLRARRASRIKQVVIWSGSIALIVGALWIGAIEEDPNNPLVARAGVHHHAKLAIEVNGETVKVPGGIGLISGMEHPQQMHTHEDDQVVHVEIPGRVYENETRLINFFNVWGKDLTATSLMGVTATDTQKVFMTVNGKDEPRLGDYPIKDGDDIKVVLR
jgi:hypothetical protein